MTIGEGVGSAHGAVIEPGTMVGDGAVIGAMAVVRNVPAYCSRRQSVSPHLPLEPALEAVLPPAARPSACRTKRRAAAPRARSAAAIIERLDDTRHFGAAEEPHPERSMSAANRGLLDSLGIVGSSSKMLEKCFGIGIDRAARGPCELGHDDLLRRARDRPTRPGERSRFTEPFPNAGSDSARRSSPAGDGRDGKRFADYAELDTILDRRARAFWGAVPGVERRARLANAARVRRGGRRGGGLSPVPSLLGREPARGALARRGGALAWIIACDETGARTAVGAAIREKCAPRRRRSESRRLREGDCVARRGREHGRDGGGLSRGSRHWAVTWSSVSPDMGLGAALGAPRSRSSPGRSLHRQHWEWNGVRLDVRRRSSSRLCRLSRRLSLVVPVRTGADARGSRVVSGPRASSKREGGGRIGESGGPGG